MILIALIHDFSCPIGDPLRVEEKFSYLILEVLSMKSYHRDSWLASYHCEAVFIKRWIVHPLIYALELSHPAYAYSTYAISTYAISTYAISTLSNGSVPFFLFFFYTRARAAAAAMRCEVRSRELTRLCDFGDDATSKRSRTGDAG